MHTFSKVPKFHVGTLAIGHEIDLQQYLAAIHKNNNETLNKRNNQLHMHTNIHQVMTIFSSTKNTIILHQNINKYLMSDNSYPLINYTILG